MKKTTFYSLVILVINSFATAALCKNLPRVFLIDPEVLVETKARVKAGDKTLKPALNKLIAEADKALKAEPNSVMDKRAMPFSLDKHDYMSIRAYRWPDPNHRYGVPYLVRDGVVNPEYYDNKQYDHSNFGKMKKSVSDLARAYYFTEDEKYAEYAINWIRIWFLDPATRMNPHLRYAQAYPGCLGELGTGIIDATGLPNVVDAIGLLETSKHWTNKDKTGMENWFCQYLKWLRNSEQGQLSYNTHSNHGSSYDKQTTAYALFLGDKALARDILENVKTFRIEKQIEPDGSQPTELSRTKSFGYSLFNLSSMFNLAILGDRVGVDLWNYKTRKTGGLKGAMDFLAPYADPEKFKQWPHKQIKPAHPIRLIGLLRRAAIAYNDPHYEELIDKLPKDEVATHWIQLFYPKPKFK